jgi:hypothetical protein
VSDCKNCGTNCTQAGKTGTPCNDYIVKVRISDNLKDDLVWKNRVRQLETALTAAQAEIKRRDEVIEALIVAGPEFCPAGTTCGTLQCTDCWRNWIAAKLKEGAK